jgi:hypothetical protein
VAHHREVLTHQERAENHYAHPVSHSSPKYTPMNRQRDERRAMKKEGK